MRFVLPHIRLFVLCTIAWIGTAWYTQGSPVPDFEFEVPHSATVTWDSVMMPDSAADYSRVRGARVFFGEPLIPAPPQMQVVATDPSRLPDTATLWIIFSLVLIAFAKYLFPLRFAETLIASWDSRFYSQMEREGGLLNNWVSFLLFLNFLFVFVLLAYHSLDQGAFTQTMYGLPVSVLFLYLLVVAVGFYLVKYMLMIILAWVFRTREATYSYFRNILIVNIFTGVIVLPLLILYTYQPMAILLYCAWGLLVVVNLYKIVRNFVIGAKGTGFSAYYIILYLCAIELAPLLFIIKYARNLLVA